MPNLPEFNKLRKDRRCQIFAYAFHYWDVENEATIIIGWTAWLKTLKTYVRKRQDLSIGKV